MLHFYCVQLTEDTETKAMILVGGQAFCAIDLLVTGNDQRTSTRLAVIWRSLDIAIKSQGTPFTMVTSSAGITVLQRKWWGEKYYLIITRKKVIFCSHPKGFKHS